MERVKEMSLEFTSRNRQQEFISKITAEYLTDFGTVDEAAMLYTQLASCCQTLNNNNLTYFFVVFGSSLVARW